MSSFTIPSLALASLVACTSAPEIRVDVSRTDPHTSVTMTLCGQGLRPTVAPSPCPKVSVILGTSDSLDQHVEVFVDQPGPALGLFFDTANADNHAATCLELDVALGVAFGVMYSIDGSTAMATCKPASACTNVAVSAMTCVTPP